MTTERFLGCGESAVLFFEQANLLVSSNIGDIHAHIMVYVMPDCYAMMYITKKVQMSPDPTQVWFWEQD